MKPEFRFRLNGIYVREIHIRRICNPEGGVDLEIAANVPDIGWIVIDDNSHLVDKDLPRFTLEYRNETEWEKVDPILRRMSEDKGWRTVTPDVLIRVLISAGVVELD
jgi:hypothetical protein